MTSDQLRRSKAQSSQMASVSTTAPLPAAHNTPPGFTIMDLSTQFAKLRPLDRRNPAESDVERFAKGI